MSRTTGPGGRDRSPYLRVRRDHTVEQSGVDVSLVVVTFNNADLIERCLRAVREGIDTSRSQLLVVDNASTDDTVRRVRTTAPEATVIVLERNIGFAGANNIALHNAIGRYVVLVNSDAFPDPGAVERLIRRADSDSNIGLVGGRLRSPSGKSQPSAGAFPSLLSSLATALFLHRLPLTSRLRLSVLANRAHYRRAHRVDWVSGAFCLARPSAGPVPAAAFMYGEDVEWGAQVRQRGMTTWIEPSATAVHLIASGDSSLARARARQASRVQFELRWYRSRGRRATMTARAIMVLHATVRIGLYLLLIPVRPRLATRRVAEFLSLLDGALRTPRCAT